MKKLILPTVILSLCSSGCMMAYNSKTTGRSWLVSVASRSVLAGFRTDYRTNNLSAGIMIDNAGTEGQAELVEAAVRGAVKGAVGK